MKKFSTYIDLDIFPSKIFVFLGYKNKDKKEIYDKIGSKDLTSANVLKLVKLVDDLDLDTNYGQVISIESAHIIALKDFNLKNVIHIATLSHELNHVVWATARYIGLNPSEDSEEFYTYVQDYLLKKVLTEYKNVRSKLE